MADVVWTICECDMSTVGIVGAFFEWHINTIGSLALSFDGTLFVSTPHDASKVKTTNERRRCFAAHHWVGKVKQL
jgi:hypothetical protein